MKNVLAKGGIRAVGGIAGSGSWLSKFKAGRLKARADDTAARAAKNTPAYNAQADATVVPPSEEERRRRKSSTVLNPTDKLG